MWNTLRQRLPILKRVLRETKSQHFLAYWYAYFLLSFLEQADHISVRKMANLMINKRINAGYYFSALSHFLCGEYHQAEKNIKKIPNFDKIPEVVFLYADLLAKQQKNEQAWSLLEQLAMKSTRKKVWIHLTNLVKSPNDYHRFHQLIENMRKDTALLKSDLLIQPRINAALRAGLGEEALYWAEKSQQAVKKSKNFTYFSEQSAKQALADLKKVLSEQNIPFFLISGTLLGCIREKKLLGHDKDIDVGVWEEQDYDTLAHHLGTSGYFYIVPTRTKQLIMLRHTNGITIDVFIHHREHNDFWHEGVKFRWHNSPFDLVETEFLGGKYLIPQNYDLYLTENYGDWQTPKKEFDSAFDTPNGEVINEIEMRVYKARNNKSNKG